VASDYYPGFYRCYIIRRSLPLRNDLEHRDNLLHCIDGCALPGLHSQPLMFGCVEAPVKPAHNPEMMKTLLIIFLSLTATALSLVRRPAAEQIWTGEIGDSHCRFEHGPIAEGDSILPSPECVRLCLKSGYKYVLIVDDKLYTISNQDNPELAKFAGQTVKLTGELTGDAITVSKIESSGR
jgi:hypothetical protein